MTKTAIWGVLCALVLGSSAAAADKDAHVVIISIDGFAGYLLDDPRAPVPMVRSLAKAGGFVAGGMKVSNPSVTWPNHTSLVTGVRPEKHGVFLCQTIASLSGTSCRVRWPATWRRNAAISS